MQHCANDACPDLLEHGRRGEYRDDVSVCPHCSHPLADGEVAEPDVSPSWVDLVPVASFTHVPSAHVARATLENAGITASIANENLASMQWLYTSAIGGVRILVAPQDVQSARELLEFNASAEMPPEPDASRDACPRCGEGFGEPSKLGFRSRALSLLVGWPFVVWRSSLTCDRCGHTWRRKRVAAT